jgi:LacI family transcriptional regulator
MFQAATIKQIAHALSVSVSTVSRALSDSHEISEETKKLIQDYAKKINYRSNPIARSLKNGRSNSIGILVADIANSFFSQTINGIESIAYEKGYHVIITQSHDAYDREVSNISHLASRSVDGILISMSSQTADYDHITQLHERGMPIVFFDRILDGIETFKVTTNNFKSAFEATKLLIEKGNRKIAFLGNAPQLSISMERLNGYRAALTSANIPYDAQLVKHCLEGGRDIEEIRFALSEFKSGSVEALLIASDQISTSTMRVLAKTDYAQHLTIIGFSNSDVIDLLSPGISYIRQNAFEIGQIAAQMLIKIIESKYPIYDFETKLLDAELHWRGV